MKQEGRENDKLFRRFSPDPTLTCTSKAPEDTTAVPVLAVKRDDPTDKTCCPTPEPDDKTPKPYDASKLKSVTKRKDRPFAPPERGVKNKAPSKRG